jgi:hypothetical protein
MTKVVRLRFFSLFGAREASPPAAFDGIGAGVMRCSPGRLHIIADGPATSREIGHAS